MLTLTYIGDEEIALITQIVREDGERAMAAASGKGKQPEGSETDMQVAIEILLEEIQQLERLSTDYRLARSMQEAIYSDRDVLLQAQHEEQIARGDRKMTLDLSNGTRSGESSPDTCDSLTDDEEFLEKLSYLYITGIEDAASNDDDDGTASDGQPENSRWAASRRSDGNCPRRRCEACGDRKHFAELAQAPCRHEYCRRCLTHLFQDSMTDESLFPPRCCRQPIPLNKNRIFLDGEVANQFCKKALEFSTPNRTYCHNRDCAIFIPPESCTLMTASCEDCGSVTCVSCKRASHDGDCPDDEELQRVIQLAREQGWQRCQNCWGMVELNTGCNHMTCRCGYQFCYICGAQWKTCGCEHWDEHRLLERAIQIDARDQLEVEEAPGEIPNQIMNPVINMDEPGHIHQQGDRQAIQDELIHLPEELEQQAQRQRRLQTIMQDLDENHECEHVRWQNRSGPRRCEECHDLMPMFIYECRQCHIMACRRCRHHRL